MLTTDFYLFISHLISFDHSPSSSAIFGVLDIQKRVECHEDHEYNERQSMIDSLGRPEWLCSLLWLRKDHGSTGALSGELKGREQSVALCDPYANSYLLYHHGCSSGVTCSDTRNKSTSVLAENPGPWYSVRFCPAFGHGNQSFFFFDPLLCVSGS